MHTCLRATGSLDVRALSEESSIKDGDKKSHWCEVFGTGHNHAALIIGFLPDPRSELDVALCGVLRNKVKKEAEGWSG
jgi:hypothetical protein